MIITLTVLHKLKCPALPVELQLKKIEFGPAVWSAIANKLIYERRDFITTS